MNATAKEVPAPQAATLNFDGAGNLSKATGTGEGTQGKYTVAADGTLMVEPSSRCIGRTPV